MIILCVPLFLLGTKPGYFFLSFFCDQIERWIVTDCETYKYGIGCTEDCGYCINGRRCNHINGFCYAGCETGYYGSQCKMGKVVMF